MKITLKKLVIKDFKGIKSLDVGFTPETIIRGANRSGKTTIVDAVSWLLFGKESTGRKDFNIKPLDSKGKSKPKIDNEVHGTFDIDGSEVTYSRILREKWVKKRGELEAVFSGNETIFEINEVPVPAKKFAEKINDLLDEDLFKLVTSPLYFNTLHWEERRSMLMSLVEMPEHGEILEFMDPSEVRLLKTIDIDEKKAETKAKIKRLKEELKFIPTRIDEVIKGRPEKLDWRKLQAEANEFERSLKTVEEQIKDKSKIGEAFLGRKLVHQSKLEDAAEKISDYVKAFNSKNIDTEKESSNDLSSLRMDLNLAKMDASNNELHIKNQRSTIEKLEVERQDLLKEYHAENAEKFEENTCHYCGQKVPENQIIKHKASFEETKAKILSKIKYQGIDIVTNIDNAKAEILDLKKSCDLKLKKATKLEADILKLEETTFASVEKDPEYIKMQAEYKELENSFTEKETPIDNPVILEDKKTGFKKEIDRLKEEISTAKSYNKSNERIKELEAEEKNKSVLLVELEGLEFAIEKYNNIRIKSIENRVNSKFKHVSFKLFETQINGAEKETCKTTLNGVPYEEVNSEGKINSGLDIINVFSKKFNVFAPIFIDNAESITDIFKVNTQVIKLYVDPKYKTLDIS